ncbi:MAG: ATP-binding cassette domain-containing protein [Actinobacteria bacterium]|nr:ATP-binding cassette domain-containing protein [Actinomycetota bacterium]
MGDRGNTMTLSVAGDIGKGTYSLSVDFSIEPGEVVGIVGRNGAGKTTLIETIAGIVPMVAGSVALNGTDWDNAPRNVWMTPEERRCAVVFQDLRLFPHMTAIQNVAFGLRARGMSKGEANILAAQKLQVVGAEHLADRRASVLSGGEAQRVALARAIATDPAVLLLDEPLSAIDAASKEPLREVVATVLRQFTGIALLVSHDPTDVATLATRTITLGG